MFKQKRISDLVESFVYLNVSLTLFLQSGYAISYGSYSVTAGILFSTLSAVICLLLLASQKIVKKHRLALCSLLLILVCVISLVRLSIFKYEVVRAGGPLMPWDTYKLYTSSIISMGLTSTNYLTFFKTASYCILAGAAHIYLNAENWKRIIKKCYRIGKAVVIYGIIELIFAYILRKNLYSTVTSLFIGRSSFTYTTLGESRGVNVMLQGITREPSFYAVQMFFILILFTAEGVLFKDKYAKYWNLIVIALMLLSMSFTSLLMIALYAYIMYLRMNTGKRIVIATVLFLFFPLFMVRL